MNIDIIIKYGTVEKKMFLLMTDIADFNTKSYSTLKVENGVLTVKNRFLTDYQRNEILKDISNQKNEHYFRKLQSFNQSFMILKPTIEGLYQKVIYLSYALRVKASSTLKLTMLESTINEMINALDVESKAKMIDATQNIGEGFNEAIGVTIEARYEIKKNSCDSLLDELNETKAQLKKVVLTSNNILKEFLPVYPYLDYLQNIEKKILESENHEVYKSLDFHRYEDIDAYKNII